jgi:hypothetical protein
LNNNTPLLTNGYQAEIYAAGKMLRMGRKNKAIGIPVIKDGSEIIPSCVVPVISKSKILSVQYVNESSVPILIRCSSVLNRISWNEEERELYMELLAFKSKADSVMIQYTSVPENLTINNKPNKDWQFRKKGSKNIEIVAHFIFDSNKAEIRIKF